MSSEPRPLRKDAERNRRRVLDAAQHLFAEHGLDVTLEEIAREAGVGVITLYRRFPNKEALIGAVFERRLDDLCRLAEEALAEPDSWTAFATFLERSGSEHVIDRGMREVVLGGDAWRIQAKERLYPLVERLLARARADGAIRADLTVQDLPLIALSVATIAERTRHAGGRFWQRYQRLVIDGLRAPGAVPLETEPLTTHDLDVTVGAWAIP